MTPLPESLRIRIREQLREQADIVRSLLRLREQLQGSLIVRYGLCGKEACVCQRGRKHGPYYVLSTRRGGKGGFAYLTGTQLRKARERVARYRSFKAGLRRLQRLNRALLGLLRRYQAHASRTGGRRLGLPMSVNQNI